MVHVPYRGVGPAFADLLAGHIAMMAPTPVELRPHLASGKLKLLGASGAERSKFLPEVPTISETLPSPAVVTWNGIVVPARTPQPIVDALSREIMAAEQSPEFLERLAKIGVEPIVHTPDDFAKIIAADLDRWRVIIQDLGLKVN
jgi:tripartite-type tricarboxylate transporter receptor subunit TctC